MVELDRFIITSNYSIMDLFWEDVPASDGGELYKAIKRRFEEVEITANFKYFNV